MKAKRKHRYHLNSLWSIWYGILFTYFQGYLILNGAYRFLGKNHRNISMNLHFLAFNRFWKQKPLTHRIRKVLFNVIFKSKETGKKRKEEKSKENVYAYRKNFTFVNEFSIFFSFFFLYSYLYFASLCFPLMNRLASQMLMEIETKGCYLIQWRNDSAALTELNSQIILCGMALLMLPLFFISAIFKVRFSSFRHFSGPHLFLYIQREI